MLSVHCVRALCQHGYTSRYISIEDDGFLKDLELRFGTQSIAGSRHYIRVAVATVLFARSISGLMHMRLQLCPHCSRCNLPIEHLSFSALQYTILTFMKRIGRIEPQCKLLKHANA